jgi:hypothetical protein
MTDAFEPLREDAMAEEDESEPNRIDRPALDVLPMIGIASSRSVANDPNPSLSPKSTALGEISMDWSGVASMPEDGPDEVVPLESEDGGPDKTWLDIRLASVLRFFSPGDRPIVDGDSGPGVEEPVDATRRPEVGDPYPKVGRVRLIVDALAAVP